MMTEFEDILEDLGSFGPLQIQIFILVSMFETPAAWGLLVHPIFAALSPDWSCHQETGNSTTVNPLAENESVNNWTSGNCSVYGSDQCDSVVYHADYSSIVTEWSLVCDDTYLPKLLTTLQMIGVLVGACAVGQLADTFGRKKVLFGVYAPFLLFGLVSAFAPNIILYMVMRILVGFCFGGVMVVNFVLPLEFVTPKWRTFCGCIGFWACGLMSLALLAFLIRDWRYLTVTCFAGGIPMFFTWWFIPESPRWLLIKGRQEEAEKILTYMAHRNKRPVPDFSKLQQFVQREKQKRQKLKQHSYWDLCRNFSLTRTTVIILFSWFVSSSVYYGTTFGAGQLHGNMYLNLFLSGLVEIPALIFVVLVNNRIGRKITIAVLMSLAGLACLSVLLINLLDGDKRLSTGLALVGKSGIAGGWAAVQVSSAEVFPTAVRNIGIGASSMAARIGLIVAPLIAELGKLHEVIPFAVFGVLALLCGLLSLLLPETLNHPLPDYLPPRQFCLRCLGEEDGQAQEENISINGHVTNVGNHREQLLSQETKNMNGNGEGSVSDSKTVKLLHNGCEDVNV